MKHNALAILLDPDEDQYELVRKYWDLPKDRTHIMLFGHNNRRNAFIEWHFSQCGYRVRLIIPERWALADWNEHRVLDWVNRTKWFPVDSRLIVLRTRNVVRVLNQECDIEMNEKPLYVKDVKVEIV